MPNFDELFVGSNCKSTIYKGKSIVSYDDFPFENGDHLAVTFEKTNSEWKQGIGLDVFGTFEIKGEKYQDRIVLWEDTSPKTMHFTLWENEKKRKQPKSLPKKGLLGVKNVWDPGTGTISSWIGGAAMIVEEIENGRRYYCNDGHPDENFDDIVFTIQRVANSATEKPDKSTDKKRNKTYKG